MTLIFSLGGLIVWYIGGRDVLGGTMTLGSLMAFLAYLAMFYTPLATLSQLTTWLTSFLSGCQRIFEVLDAPEEAADPALVELLPTARGEIIFDHVTFGYERHRPVLKDVNFRVRPGERIGIVGHSGSGKSTLVNLLSRFYDADEGHVLLDGVDIRELAKNDLRRHIGVVLQEPFLFRGTIHENIAYGRPDAPRDSVVAAAVAAQAHDFILRTPLGYDTAVGERGAGLSGGEKQRISIARALLYDPRVLILDEATSSVDTESEKAVQEGLRYLTHGRTTLAIAHRLSTLYDSDRIFVFDHGQLIEQGSHAELMRQNGKYARLVSIQSRIARERRFESLLNEAGDGSTETEPAVETDSQANDCPVVPRWLEPGDADFRAGPHDSLEVHLPSSIRSWNEDGHERELGVLRRMNRWPVETRRLLAAALARRYLLRKITGFFDIRLQSGYLTCKAQTEEGPVSFTMRWSQSQTQDFGSNGKILLDLEDNRFLIPDAAALPPRDRELLERYIYW
jgi:ABC-type multidrug transport system ATPase subunit